MRTLYGERRQLLIDAVTRHFGDALPVMGDEAGLHFVLGLPDHCDDRAITAAAYDAGVIVRPLTSYYSGAQRRQGLLTGYACVPHDEIDAAFATLARVIEAHAFAGDKRTKRRASA
jgi:GntR family transcriptional regulator/MocR family aminotransferase